MHANTHRSCGTSWPSNECLLCQIPNDASWRKTPRRSLRNSGSHCRFEVGAPPLFQRRLKVFHRAPKLALLESIVGVFAWCFIQAATRVSWSAVPCITCVAITGSFPTRAHNPNPPISIAGKVESTQAAFKAGATIVDAHVRDGKGFPTSDPQRFARLMEGVRRHCPGMIVQLSTGGRPGGPEKRAARCCRCGQTWLRLRSGRTTFPPSSLKTRPIWWTGWRGKCACMGESPRSRLLT